MSLSYRVIARLDIKGSCLIKGCQMEGLRKVGDPIDHARRYCDQGADELLFLHVASLYGKYELERVLESVAAQVFVPITAGGGVASIEDFDRLMRAGADKVAINSAAVSRPELIGECAQRYGSQAIVAQIDARRCAEGGWRAHVNQGRDDSGWDALDWMQRVQELGAGEILLTSIDRDGTRNGPEPGLTRQLDIPLVYSGGVTSATAAAASRQADALAIGAALHYGETVGEIKRAIGACHAVR